MNPTQFEILVKRMIGLGTPKVAGRHCKVANKDFVALLITQ